MARLGIDFGTTNTVVVAWDRGQFPVLVHRVPAAGWETVEEVFPSSIFLEAARGPWHFGPEAERRARRAGAGASGAYLPSLKRRLRTFADGQTIDLGLEQPVLVEELLRAFLAGLRESILRSGFIGEREKLECVISWPAHANGAQRHLTRRAFREAGFDVLGSVNEPTASAVEFADRVTRGNRGLARDLRSAVLVFDLGGGTFDASLVSIEGGVFRVVDSAGLDRLGGDDFDAVLLEMLLAAAGSRPEELDRWKHAALLRHARKEKESLSRDPERNALELVPSDFGLGAGGRPGRPVRVPVAAYFERLEPLVADAVREVERILHGPCARRDGVEPDRLEAIYLVGGASRLPLIGELLRRRFPEARLLASDKPFTSVAMGAAIVAAERARVSDIIARHFGVIRLGDAGRREYFAPIFASGTRLPRQGDPPLEVEVRYSPRHNIGRLRYLECARVGPDGLPFGDARQWCEILFPYDPAIPPERPLSPAEVAPAEGLSGTSVVERYWCDSDGVISVKLERKADGGRRTFEITGE